MKKGFTLSEVLITLVILGVVAAMTIPTVVNEVRDMQYRAHAKKTYSMISGAMSMITLKGGTLAHVAADGNTNNIRQWFHKYLKNNLQFIKICEDTKGCWHEEKTTYGLNKKEVYCAYNGKIGGNVITAIMADGTAIDIDSYGQASISNYFGVELPPGTSGITFFFDVNGARKPNVLGRDIYAMVYKDDVLVPAWSDMSEDDVKKNCSKQFKGGISGHTNIAGYSCLQKIISEG